MNPLSLFTSITIRYDNQWNHCTCIWLFGSFLFPSQISKSKSKLLLASGSFMGVFPIIASSVQSDHSPRLAGASGMKSVYYLLVSIVATVGSVFYASYRDPSVFGPLYSFSTNPLFFPVFRGEDVS